jgi:hypothetical protein
MTRGRRRQRTSGEFEVYTRANKTVVNIWDVMRSTDFAYSYIGPIPTCRDHGADNSDKQPGTIGERACLQYVGHDTIARGEAGSELCQENA